MTEAVKKEAMAIYNQYFNMGCGFDKSPKLAIIHIEGLIAQLNETLFYVTPRTDGYIIDRIKHLEQVKAYLEEKIK